MRKQHWKLRRNGGAVTRRSIARAATIRIDNHAGTSAETESTRLAPSINISAMENVLDRPWTTESFLASDDQQEGKYEFDGQNVVRVTGGSIAHQRIVVNLWLALADLLRDTPRMPMDQRTRKVADALAIFEVISDDTAAADRVVKLNDHAAAPSLRTSVRLEQDPMAATVFHREPGGEWCAPVPTSTDLALTGLDITLPVARAYQGLNFPA